MNYTLVISFLLCSFAFGFSNVSTFTAQWLTITLNGEEHGIVGHIHICHKDNCIVKINSTLDTHGKKTAFAFSILKIICFLLSLVFVGLGALKDHVLFLRIGGSFAIVGGTLSILSAAIYTVENPLKSGDIITLGYGYSYTFAWVIGFIGIAGGILAIFGDFINKHFNFMNKHKVSSSTPSSSVMDI